MCINKVEKTENLRIHPAQKQNRITITVNGIKIDAVKGESVHAALTAAGIRHLKVSKSGEPRGVFCGMGICYECLVTIDNVPDQRACMTIVRDQMEVTIGISDFSGQDQHHEY